MVRAPPIVREEVRVPLPPGITLRISAEKVAMHYSVAIPLFAFNLCIEALR
jgi:hypothetical protein